MPPLADHPSDADTALFPFGFFVFGTLLLLGLSFAFSHRQFKRAWANLEYLASALGLPPPPARTSAFFSRLPELRGLHRGRELHLYTFSTGSGKSRQHWCALAVTVRNPADLTLKLSEENVLTRIGKKLGLKEQSVGEPRFDQRFFIDTPRSENAAILLPEWCHTWQRTLPASARGAILIEGTTLCYQEPGHFTDRSRGERFLLLTPLLLQLADALDVMPSSHSV